jgi:hypothetical protein
MIETTARAINELPRAMGNAEAECGSPMHQRLLGERIMQVGGALMVTMSATEATDAFSTLAKAYDESTDTVLRAGLRGLLDAVSQAYRLDTF